MRVNICKCGVTVVFAALAVTGCSVTPGEPDSADPPAHSSESARRRTTAESALPGYVHTLSASKFTIGASVDLELNTSTLQRWRGSLGAFAVDPSNGWCMAILDATTPMSAHMTDDTAQASLVRSYFVSAGIPGDQVASVVSSYQVGGGGAMVASTMSEPPQLGSINSVLMRATGGVPIVESFAAARMTTDGAVDWEAVFWPPISMTVIDQALAFSAKMGDATQHRAFVSRLGTVYRDVGVVIHHTTSYFHGAPQAFVSYDAVIDPDSTAAERHFDATGAEFRLPQEHTTGQPGSR